MNDSSWTHSLKRKAWKTALVVVLFLAFSQWYLPRKGYKLAAGPGDPGYISAPQFMLEERHVVRMELLKNKSELTKGKMWKNGMRASRPQWPDKKPHRVLLVGGSWTFGTGVNDEQTFPWLLGKMFSSCAFDNAGVPGYGPYTALYALHEYMPRHHYDMVLYLATERHLFRDGYLCAGMTSKRDDQRDALFVRPYCGLRGPAAGEERPRLVYHHGGCISWPGDRLLYFVNFAKLAAMEIYKPLSLQLESYGAYSRFLNDEAYACQRFRLLLDDLDSYVRAQNCAFGFVGLDELCYILKRNGTFGEHQPNADTVGWPANFPVLDARYPVDINTYRELRTKPTRLDDGWHPGPLVQAYYAQTIGDWLARSEVAGSWIGGHKPVPADTGVRAGKCVAVRKKNKAAVKPVEHKDTGVNDDEFHPKDLDSTFAQWELVPAGK